MEFYLAVKKNGLLIHTTAWMSLKIIIGNEDKKEYILHNSIYIKF